MSDRCSAGFTERIPDGIVTVACVLPTGHTGNHLVETGWHDPGADPAHEWATD